MCWFIKEYSPSEEVILARARMEEEVAAFMVRQQSLKAAIDLAGGREDIHSIKASYAFLFDMSMVEALRHRPTKDVPKSGLATFFMGIPVYSYRDFHADFEIVTKEFAEKQKAGRLYMRETT
jgi:hypothetical protein